MAMTDAQRRELRKNGPLAQCLRQLERDFTPAQRMQALSGIRAAAQRTRGGK